MFGGVGGMRHKGRLIYPVTKIHFPNINKPVLL